MKENFIGRAAGRGEDGVRMEGKEGRGNEEREAGAPESLQGL